MRGSCCLGLCARGPLVRVELDTGREMVYQQVQPTQATEIAASLAGHAAAPVNQLDLQAPFFSRQVRVVTANAGRIDPESIDDYLAVGGYEALSRAVTSTSPQDVVAEVSRSGLRGRGGAGFPTGVKWGLVARVAGDDKYVICNGDEGDPGAFMDRSVMEGDPHRVLEGMAIGAYAVGASQGYIYVRGEYPLAIRRLQRAIRQAEHQGVLGTRICDTPFHFRVDIRIGGGAFVCGEETALIASIEGGRGQPHARPPYPAQAGVWGKPTLINNVETFANIAPIVMQGGAWYAGYGTEKSRGTKVFALAGKINNTGLVEVPFGITVRELIEDIGGGIAGGRPFKAIQTGGPSGGCVPASMLDLPIDYDSLASVGTIVGSGGLLVMDDSACMVDVARFYMDFCMHESCGKCIPCRTGTAEAVRILDRLCSGLGTPDDLERLELLLPYMQDASLCGLGQTAPNPVVSTLRYFRDEYLAHIQERVCPAGVCRMTGAPTPQARAEARA
ncbi:MAG TPA: NADH-quinone oxidoreductase subunit F [Acetobacteraceae bacterium]|nr:NADH-quinone oxidoreductase subunit F [Acetobacteraceae bacterium]